MRQYTVQKGDTLYGISSQFGVSVDDIKKANSLNSNVINVGQILNIPTVPNSNYVVKPGDTLYSIAKKYNTTIDLIIMANNLTSNTLRVGQVLLIPDNIPDNTGYTYYIVKKGDSLYSIAKKNNTEVSEIISLNNLKSNLLSIGQVLKIPSKVIDLQPSAIYTPYTVKKGDSLYSIASNNGISMLELKIINNLSNNTLKVGQILNIPKSSFVLECIGSGYEEPKYVTYTVKKGDSLYVIANKYNVSVDSIKSLNNLTSNLLNIGQVLKIKEVS